VNKHYYYYYYKYILWIWTIAGEEHRSRVLEVVAPSWVFGRRRREWRDAGEKFI